MLQRVYCTDDWYEADMYFEGPEGYRFVAANLSDAHDWCFDHFTIACRNQSPCIIVSNTFTTAKEYQPYQEYAEGMGYRVQIIHCEGDFGSVHNVPTETILRMRARWEPVPDKNKYVISGKEIKTEKQYIWCTDGLREYH